MAGNAVKRIIEGKRLAGEVAKGLQDMLDSKPDQIIGLLNETHGY